MKVAENVDLIDLKQRLCEVRTLENERVGESHTLESLQELGYAKQSITQAEHIYLLSERGYAEMYICDVPKWEVTLQKEKIDRRNVEVIF